MELLDVNMTHRILLFVLFLNFVKNATCSQKRWKRNSDFDGKFLPSGSTILVRSRLHCGKMCLENDACRSFFFLVDSLCNLRNDILNSVDGLQDVDKTTYYILYEGELDLTTPLLAPTAPAVTTAPMSAPVTTIPTFTCPPEDSKFRTIYLSDGHPFTYKVVKTLTIQSGARTACNNEGAFLARVKTVAKMNMLLNLIINCTGYFGAVDYYVDGSNTYFSDDEDVAPWRFFDGSYVPMSNDFWALSYPNHLEGENCLSMRAEEDFMLQECYCTRECYFICEK